MQTLLVIRGGRVTVQTAEKTYTDTVENFVIDGGVMPTDFVEIDYCRDTGGCLIDGVPADAPAYAENVIQRIDVYVESFESRKAIREEAERIERSEREAIEQAEAEQARIAAMTPEERAEYDMEIAKGVRADAVEAIVVTVDGMQFDGDEVSQERISRAVSNARARADRINRDKKLAYLQQIDGMTPEAAADVPEPVYDDYLAYTTVWITADNQIVYPTIDQLSRAGDMAGSLQSGFWPVPYEEVSDGAINE